MKKILIVDDSKEVRELVHATLGHNNYKVLEASDGNNAVEYALKHKPDLIIMDVMMPGEVDGIEAIRRIRHSSVGHSCPVIILTGSGIDRKREGLDAGACVFFSKPFSPLALISKIENILETGNGQI